MDNAATPIHLLHALALALPRAAAMPLLFIPVARYLYSWLIPPFTESQEALDTTALIG